MYLQGEEPVETVKSNKYIVELCNNWIKIKMRLGTVFTLSDSEMDNTEVVLVWSKPSDRYIRVWHLVVRHKSTQSEKRKWG